MSFREKHDYGRGGERKGGKSMVSAPKGSREKGGSYGGGGNRSSCFRGGFVLDFISYGPMEDSAVKIKRLKFALISILILLKNG